MRISGNYFDRLRYCVFPLSVFCGMICGIFSTHTLQAFLWLGGAILAITWLIDTLIIFQKFGIHLNQLILTDTILFNGNEIHPSQILTIETQNIYPDSIISKWTISTIRLTLNDHSNLYILAKPHSVFFYIQYLTDIFWNYFKDWRRYKRGIQRGYAPLSSCFVKETSQTLHLLILKYPGLKPKVL